MARFEYTGSLTSSRTVEECREAAISALTALNSDPRTDGSGQIVGALGSGLAIRLIGGLIAPSRWFPVRVAVSIEDTGTERRSLVRVSEDFGIGSLRGIEEKVRKRCVEVGSALVERLKGRQP